MKTFKRLTVGITLAAFLSATTPSKAQAASGGAILGWGLAGLGAAALGYLGYRAYENHEANERAESDYYESGGTYYSGDDDYGGGDAAYETWEEHQSEAQKKAEIQQAFNQQMATNARMITKLKATFDQRLQQTKSTTSAKYLCMSFCGSYQDSTVLSAKIVSATGDTMAAANKAIGAACTGKNEMLFDAVGTKAQNYALQPPQDACIPATATVNDVVAEAKTNTTVVHAYVYNVEILPDSTPVSAQFSVEATRQAAAQIAMTDGKSAANIEKNALSAGFDLSTDMTPDLKLSKPGYIVLDNSTTATSPQDKESAIMDALSEPAYGVKIITQSPLSVEVNCKDETHTVRITAYMYPDGSKVKTKTPSSNYVTELASAAVAPPLNNSACEAASSSSADKPAAAGASAPSTGQDATDPTQGVAAR